MTAPEKMSEAEIAAAVAHLYKDDTARQMGLSDDITTARAIESARDAQWQAEVAELHETLQFVERWAVHHGSKPHMTPSEALSCIQHYPAIKAITASYSDGKEPSTPNPFEQRDALAAEVDRLQSMLNNADCAWQARLDAAVRDERERAGRVCDDEARARTEAGNCHPEDSESRGRCFAGARAAINCAKGVRSSEVVDAIRSRK